MPEYSVAAYTFKIRQKYASATSANYLRLTNFDQSNSDLLQFIYAFCNSVTTKPIKHKTEGKYLQVLNVNEQGRIIRSEMESGGYGLRSRLVDVEMNSESYQRTINDAELLPLRNLFAVPLDSPTGLFITERVGIRGLKSTFVAALQRSFGRTYPDFALDVNALAPEQAVKSSLDKGELKGIRLVRYGIPRDLEEQYYLGAHEKEIGTVETILKPDRGMPFSKRRLEQALESDDRAGLLEWRGLDYHDIKLEVKVGRQTRTLTVTKDKPPRVTFPIDDDAGG